MIMNPLDNGFCACAVPSDEWPNARGFLLKFERGAWEENSGLRVMPPVRRLRRVPVALRWCVPIGVVTFAALFTGGATGCSGRTFSELSDGSLGRDVERGPNLRRDAEQVSDPDAAAEDEGAGAVTCSPEPRRFGGRRAQCARPRWHRRERDELHLLRWALPWRAALFDSGRVHALLPAGDSHRDRSADPQRAHLLSQCGLRRGHVHRRARSVAGSLQRVTRRLYRGSRRQRFDCHHLRKRALASRGLPRLFSLYVGSRSHGRRRGDHPSRTGASRDAIMQEYLLSQASVGAYPVSLTAVLDEIQRRGGVMAYLLASGVSAEAVAQLRAHMTAP